MSDQTTETNDSGDAANSVAVEPGSAEVPAPLAGRRPRTTGGQTYVDRYLTPLIIPIAAVAVIIFYVLNLSRALLSGTDTISVVIGIIVTVAILFGAATLSAAPRMRSNSLVVLLGVSLAALAFTGWLTVGHAQEEKSAAEVSCTGGTTYNVAAASAPTLHFNAGTAVKAGCVQVSLGGDAGHTLAWKPGGPTGPILHSDSSGPQKFGWDLKAGTYTFYCTVDGHDAAGMHLTITVK